ncbi:MAG: WYL domain-containing transcriptional regulator [Lachnospiraceae bacterium]|nr:WYL domain-containing transcriptional regulator [Lachnospiraceae bacterium]
MAKSSNQKLKQLYLLRILSEYTDENHAMTTQELIEKLAEYDVSAERKSIYSDIEALNTMGFDILNDKSRNHNGYYMASRDFELPELKLLVDAVQSSRFITEKKSKELIGKLEKLCSKYDGSRLQRQVYVSDRLKTENENIYYNVDGIHEAIQKDRQISFRYYEWDADKNMRYKKEGKRYVVSPYLLVWNDANYYLVAYEEESGMIRHYRVDKMTGLQETENGRLGKSEYQAFSPGMYTRKSFQMFGGEETTVTMQCDESMAGVMIDRFGKEVVMRRLPEGKLQVRTEIVVSPPFYGWVAGLNGKVKITAPEEVAEEAKEYLLKLLEKWNQ